MRNEVTLKEKEALLENSVKKERKRVEVKEKLSRIVALEIDWCYLYDKYHEYYSGMPQFQFQHESVMQELWCVYFGDIGRGLYCGVTPLINYWRKVDTKQEIVDRIYQIYWPEPERIIAEISKREIEECSRESKKQHDREYEQLALITRKSKEFGMEEHELIELAQRIVGKKRDYGGK